MTDPTRRNILKAGAAAAAVAAMPRVLAQQAGNGGTGTFYERGPVRIRYEEAGASGGPGRTSANLRGEVVPAGGPGAQEWNAR